MSTDEKPVTVKQFNDFVENLQEVLTSNADYVFQRFDALDNKLDSLDSKISEVEKTLSYVQGKITLVKKDTELIPPIFEILHTDGQDIAKLNIRVKKLEN